MKIQFSLSGFIKSVRFPFDINSPEFREDIVGLPVYLDRYTQIGRIVDLDPEADLIYAEVPDKKYEKMILDSKGFNMCSFEIAEE